jgi:hypothetical protein
METAATKGAEGGKANPGMGTTKYTKDTKSEPSVAYGSLRPLVCFVYFVVTTLPAR